MNIRNARGIGHWFDIRHRNDERAGSPVGRRGRNLLITHPPVSFSIERQCKCHPGEVTSPDVT